MSTPIAERLALLERAHNLYAHGGMTQRAYKAMCAEINNGTPSQTIMMDTPPAKRLLRSSPSLPGSASSESSAKNDGGRLTSFFTYFVKKGDEFVVATPPIPSASFTCKGCDKSFERSSGLATHQKTCPRHLHLQGIEEGDEDGNVEGGTSKLASLLGQQARGGAGGGRRAGDNKEQEQGEEEEEEAEGEEDEEDEEEEEEKEDVEQKKRKREFKHRFQYELQYKEDVITEILDRERKGEKGVQAAVADANGIPRQNVNLWMKNREKILEAAADRLKRCYKRVGKTVKYSEMEETLVREMKMRREKGLRVTEMWLRVRARVLSGDPNFKASHGWMVRFAWRARISPRRKTNIKKKKVEDRLPTLQKWHSDLVSKVILSGDNPDPKWGRFKPEERVNVDQVPLPFVYRYDTTWEPTGAKTVWLAQPAPGLDKRMCTLQVPIVTEGEQPRPALIFRGKGLRISRAEKEAYHPDVDIYWQEKAWVDRDIAMKWLENTWKPFVSKHPDRNYVLFLDCLDAHVRGPLFALLLRIADSPFFFHFHQVCEDFRKGLSKLRTLAWYGPGGCTDLWQPVDQGLGRLFKVEISKQQQEWLERDEENLEKWENGKITASERRVLITHWVGEAAKKVYSDKETIRRFMQRGEAGLGEGDGREKNKHY